MSYALTIRAFRADLESMALNAHVGCQIETDKNLVHCDRRVYQPKHSLRAGRTHAIDKIV